LLTRIPEDAHSTDSVLLMFSIPARAAALWTMPGYPLSMTRIMLTMLPPCSFMYASNTVLVTINVPFLIPSMKHESEPRHRVHYAKWSVQVGAHDGLPALELQIRCVRAELTASYTHRQATMAYSAPFAEQEANPIGAELYRC
jgi:hypothetical protein